MLANADRSLGHQTQCSRIHAQIVWIQSCRTRIGQPSGDGAFDKDLYSRQFSRNGREAAYRLPERDLCDPMRCAAQLRLEAQPNKAVCGGEINFKLFFSPRSGSL